MSQCNRANWSKVKKKEDWALDLISSQDEKKYESFEDYVANREQTYGLPPNIRDDETIDDIIKQIEEIDKRYKTNFRGEL